LVDDYKEKFWSTDEESDIIKLIKSEDQKFELDTEEVEEDNIPFSDEDKQDVADVLPFVDGKGDETAAETFEYDEEELFQQTGTDGFRFDTFTAEEKAYLISLIDSQEGDLINRIQEGIIAKTENGKITYNEELLADIDNYLKSRGYSDFNLKSLIDEKLNSDIGTVAEERAHEEFYRLSDEDKGKIYSAFLYNPDFEAQKSLMIEEYGYTKESYESEDDFNQRIVEEMYVKAKTGNINEVLLKSDIWRNIEEIVDDLELSLVDSYGFKYIKSDNPEYTHSVINSDGKLIANIKMVETSDSLLIANIEKEVKESVGTDLVRSNIELATKQGKDKIKIVFIHNPLGPIIIKKLMDEGTLTEVKVQDANYGLEEIDFDDEYYQNLNPEQRQIDGEEVNIWYIEAKIYPETSSPGWYATESPEQNAKLLSEKTDDTQFVDEETVPFLTQLKSGAKMAIVSAAIMLSIPFASLASKNVRDMLFSPKPVEIQVSTPAIIEELPSEPTIETKPAEEQIPDITIEIQDEYDRLGSDVLNVYKYKLSLIDWPKILNKDFFIPINGAETGFKDSEVSNKDAVGPLQVRWNSVYTVLEKNGLLKKYGWDKLNIDGWEKLSFDEKKAKLHKNFRDNHWPKIKETIANHPQGKDIGRALGKLYFEYLYNDLGIESKNNMIASYNAGPNKIPKEGKIPNTEAGRIAGAYLRKVLYYEDTIKYVRKELTRAGFEDNDDTVRRIMQEIALHPVSKKKIVMNSYFLAIQASKKAGHDLHVDLLISITNHLSQMTKDESRVRFLSNLFSIKYEFDGKDKHPKVKYFDGQLFELAVRMTKGESVEDYVAEQNKNKDTAFWKRRSDMTWERIMTPEEIEDIISSIKADEDRYSWILDDAKKIYLSENDIINEGESEKSSFLAMFTEGLEILTGTSEAYAAEIPSAITSQSQINENTPTSDLIHALSDEDLTLPARYILTKRIISFESRTISPENIDLLFKATKDDNEMTMISAVYLLADIAIFKPKSFTFEHKDYLYSTLEGEEEGEIGADILATLYSTDPNAHGDILDNVLNKLDNKDAGYWAANFVSEAYYQLKDNSDYQLKDNSERDYLISKVVNNPTEPEYPYFYGNAIGFAYSNLQSKQEQEHLLNELLSHLDNTIARDAASQGLMNIGEAAIVHVFNKNDDEFTRLSKFSEMFYQAPSDSDELISRTLWTIKTGQNKLVDTVPKSELDYLLRSLTYNVKRNVFLMLDIDMVFEIYDSPLFREKTKDLTSAERFSFLLTVYRDNRNEGTGNYNLDNNINQRLQQRNEGANIPLIWSETHLISFTHDEIIESGPRAGQDNFNSEHIIAFAKDCGAKKFSSFHGPSEKDKGLSEIEHSSGPITIHFANHGGMEHEWLSKGKVGQEVSDNLNNPNSISYKELGDKLLKRGDIGQVVIMIDSCFSYDFAVNLYKYLIENNAESLPVIATETNRDYYGFVYTPEKEGTGSFWLDALIKAKPKDEPLKGEHIYKAETYMEEIQDGALFVPKDHKTYNAIGSDNDDLIKVYNLPENIPGEYSKSLGTGASDNSESPEDGFIWNRVNEIAKVSPQSDISRKMYAEIEQRFFDQTGKRITIEDDDLTEVEAEIYNQVAEELAEC